MSSRRYFQLCFLAALILVFVYSQRLHSRFFEHVNPSAGGGGQVSPKTSLLTHLASNILVQQSSNLSRVSSSASPDVNRLGSAKPPGSLYSRVLVVPRLRDDDISWIAEELSDLKVAVYVANDPTASWHPPKNKGHEVMIYFTYMIEHYYELPDTVIFMHAHRFSHHNSDLLGFDAVQMIKRLSDAHVAREGYVNMRCGWSPGCPEWLHPDSTQESLAKQEEEVLAECWTDLFPHAQLPRTLAQPCCAQFALSRDRILSIPLSRYIFYRDWILSTPLSDYVSGRIWEYAWQFLFTGQSVRCPAEHLCHCDVFGICFAGVSGYQDFEKLRREKQNHEKTIKDLKRVKTVDGNMSGIESSTSERVRYLKVQSEALDREMSVRVEDAIKRGDNPRTRALECGRAWQEGGGF